MSADFRFGVIVLAAGASSRMGRPKLLLPWGATTVIGHLIAEWQRQGAEQVVIVCAEGDAALVAELDRLQFPRENRVVNPNPGRGMFSSILCAATWPGWQMGLNHWVITLGDQPHLKAETLSALLRFSQARPDKICQPLWQGRRKHPVVLPASAFGRLGGSVDQDLKSFLEAMSLDRAFCDINDPGLEIDIDYPSDYERALGLIHGAAVSTLLAAVGVSLSIGLSAFGAEAGAPSAPSTAPAAQVSTRNQEIRLRGRIVCLPEEMHRLHQTDLPTGHAHLYGFRTNEGIYYTLLRTKTSEALFADKRLHERELIVRGLVLPNTQVLDATPIGSVRDGKLYELYYWCTVCAIKSVVPGPCMCCQDEVEFVEKPVDR